MKYCLVLIGLISLSLVGCSPSPATNTNTETEMTNKEDQAGEINQISVQELAEKMEHTTDGDHVLFIDVREVEEFEEGHIEGMVNYPLSELESLYQELSKEKEIVIICRSGNRSMQAANFLIEQGYKKITNVYGGMLEWEGPVVKK